MASSKVANDLMMKHGQSANALFPGGVRKTPSPTGDKKPEKPAPYGQHNYVLNHIAGNGGVREVATEIAQGYVADRVATQAADIKVNEDMIESVMEGSQASFFALSNAPSEEHIARGAAAQDKWLANQSALATTKPESRKDKIALRFSKISGMLKQVSDKSGVAQKSIRDSFAAISTKTSSGGNSLSAEKEGEEAHGDPGIVDLEEIGAVIIEMSTEVDDAGKEMFKQFDSEQKSVGLGPSGKQNRFMLGMESINDFGFTGSHRFQQPRGTVRRKRCLAGWYAQARLRSSA